MALNDKENTFFFSFAVKSTLNMHCNLTATPLNIQRVLLFNSL